MEPAHLCDELHVAQPAGHRVRLGGAGAHRRHPRGHDRGAVGDSAII